MYTSVSFFRNTGNAAGHEECKVRGRSSCGVISSRRLSRAGSTHRAWQELPRHLRRRAASHHVRRVPLRLRQKSRAEVGSDSAYTRTLLALTHILGDGFFASKNSWAVTPEARQG